MTDHLGHVFKPNFDLECRECGAKPTVTVVGHICPDTELCGGHFFADRTMIDWELWNEQLEDTE